MSDEIFKKINQLEININKINEDISGIKSFLGNNRTIKKDFKEDMIIKF